MIKLNDMNTADEALSHTRGGARKFDAVAPNSLRAVAPNSLHATGPNSFTGYETEYETDAAATTSIIAILVG